MKKKKVLNNSGLKVLSFVLAVLLWLVVANIENPVTTKQFKDVDVTIINESALNSINKVYEVKSGEKATFTVKGRRSVLNNLQAKDFKVVADLSHMSEVYAVPVEIAPKNENLDIEIYKNMNTMVVALEDELEGSFAVKVDTTGDVASGYALGEKEAKPNIIQVTGPKSLIQKIDSVRVTVDVSHAREDITDTGELQYYNKDGELLDKARIVAETDNVEVSVQILKTKDIPVTVNTKGDVAKGYSIEDMNYEPQEVTIAGTDDVLSQVSEIVINDVDISGLTKDKEYSFKVADYLPKDVVLTDPEQKIMVTVKVGQITERTITLEHSQIDIAGGISKYRYTIDKKMQVKVILTGFKDVIENITSNDLKPMIDVSALSAGTHLCNVTVTSQEGISTVVSGKVQVKVEKVAD